MSPTEPAPPRERNRSLVREVLGVQLPEDSFDTIGGLIAHEHGRVPRRGETVEVGGLGFTVMLTRGGAVRWFKVSPVHREIGG